ncbi:chitinase [Streptomyces formicae]|uniref:chitinase n=1 Tax=Streptomyces formicae TaxID=1616117 RepID=UPI000BF7564F|nr:chitinase [Streptomyces formicae]
MSRRGSRGVTAVLAVLLVLGGLVFGGGPAVAGAAAGGGASAHEPRFVVSERQFERMFPERNSFFTYDGLVAATRAYPEFARTGGKALRKREAAAFLANVSHETGGLFYVVAQNKDTYPIFCDETQPYGCPAGHDAYYGRGAIMLSWNFNYKAAGDALGLDLLDDPWLVERDPKVAWMTALWYWNTQSGPGTMSGHAAMVKGAGFGETIRSLNGTAECDGGNPRQMRHRVDLYVGFTEVLHVRPGRHLTC